MRSKSSDMTILVTTNWKSEIRELKYQILSVQSELPDTRQLPCSITETDNYGYLEQLKAKPRSLRFESLNKLLQHCKVVLICLLGELNYGWPYGRKWIKFSVDKWCVCSWIGDILAW